MKYKLCIMISGCTDSSHTAHARFAYPWNSEQCSQSGSDAPLSGEPSWRSLWQSRIACLICSSTVTKYDEKFHDNSNKIEDDMIRQATNFTYARVGPRDVRQKYSVCISKRWIACKRHKLLERKTLSDLLSENRVINPWRC